jgi:hypothetical protein
MSTPPVTAPSVLSLRVHLSDGSVESFFQADQAKAQQIWSSIEPVHLFAQQRLVIAGNYSNSVFVCSEIVRLDLFEPACPCWQFPDGYSDIVEISEADFRKNAHLDQPGLMLPRERPIPVGDLLVFFVKLHFRSIPPIFLMAEFSAQLPAENQSFMRFMLSKTGFHMRLGGGGVGIVNLSHLSGFTAYPGTSQAPSDSWLAEPSVIKSKGNPGR